MRIRTHERKKRSMIYKCWKSLLCAYPIYLLCQYCYAKWKMNMKIGTKCVRFFDLHTNALQLVWNKRGKLRRGRFSFLAPLIWLHFGMETCPRWAYRTGIVELVRAGILYIWVGVFSFFFICSTFINSLESGYSVFCLSQTYFICFQDVLRFLGEENAVFKFFRIELGRSFGEIGEK